MSKSRVIFPPKMNHHRRRIMADCLSMKRSTSFGKYLGCNILPNKLRRGDYVGLLEKVKASIRGWQSNFLNMAGRCTLVKSVVASYPVYSMQSTLLPVSVTKEIEKDCRKFLWNKVDKTHYLARVNWDRVCRPMTMGGLGFRRLNNWNLAFMAKLGWLILKEDVKLWVQILKARYWKKGSFLNASAKNHHSPIWRDIVKGRGVLEMGLFRRIGNGKSTSLWYHWWVGNGPLINVVVRRVPEFMTHWQVKDIIEGGRWNLRKIYGLLPQDIVKQISEVPLASMIELEDDFIWKPEKNGSFSVKSAYFLSSRLEVDNEDNGHWKGMWGKKIPFKFKLLLWNGVHNILPTGTFLSSRITNFDPQCVVCDFPYENLLHIFRDCYVAMNIWSEVLKHHTPKNHNLFFTLDWMGWLEFNLNQNDCWVSKFTTAFWHIWCSRNKAVFEKAVNHPRFLYNRVMADFFTNIKSFQVTSLKEGGATPVLRWKPPQRGFLKLNTDGAWKKEWPNAGIGGVIRDAAGNWEFGFAKKVDAGSPEAAEMMAIREGLQIAWDCNYRNLEVECDARGVVQLLSKPLEAENHPLGVIIMDICILLTRNWSVEFRHTKREGNKVAHLLAAEATHQKDERVVFISVPEHAKAVFFQDKEFVASSS